MSKTGIGLLLSLMAIGFINQQCSSLAFYESGSAIERSTKAPTRTKASYGIAKDEKLRQEIVEYAKQYLGASYKYGGTSPDGFDCSGLTSHVLGEFDIPINRSSRDQAKQGKSIKLKEAKPGDLIFFSQSGRIFHVAMVASNHGGNVKMIHSTSSRGVVLDNLNQSKYWFPKINSVRDMSQVR